MSGVTIRAMWRFAQSVVDNTQVSIGFLLSDLIDSIPNFAKETDEYSMVRANKAEKTRHPAIFH